MTGQPDIYFIRHGETDWNAEGRYQGQRDIPLNARGRKQADANGPLLRELLARDNADPMGFDWYVSPLGRTRETMDRVRAAFPENLPGEIVEPALAEISFGVFEGIVHTDLAAQGLLKPGERDTAFWHFRPDEGENYADVATRLEPFFADIKRPRIVVAHGGIARIFRAVLEDLPLAAAVNWSTPQNAVLHFSGGRMTIYESEVSAGWV